ncbi:MAG: xanthine dehydrogenase family protein molybdopterin-binding subunit [Acidimicrobiia bacterium]|nr:xanthine dehydrogenase family protein molybdopterin-binding subunit [Acidimicrobiia bacterium]
MTAVGQPLRRVEDPRLIRGQGTFVDDLRLEGMLHVAFVRSPEPRATVDRIDTAAAMAAPGVVGVFAARELGVEAAMPNLYPAPPLAESRQASPLAVGRVAYVGEPVVVVVAEDRYRAADAAELVDVDYTASPPVVDHERALDPDSPLAHDGIGSNLVAQLSAKYGDIDAAFDGADHVIDVDLRQHRGACASIEPRGVVAHLDPNFGSLTVWSSTQSPYPLRTELARYLDVPIEQLRVIAPDVGGGFGPKAAIYAEEYVVAALARRLGRPVKWIETRREHLTVTLQQRDQSHHLQVAANADGSLRGVRGRLVHDNGAYAPYGLVLPGTGLQLMPGPYVLPALDLTLDVVYTNKTPTNPIRGAGRPYATFAHERMIDAVARALGHSPVDVRRRNLIPADAFPYEVPLPGRGGGFVTYDSGNYQEALDRALEASDHAGFGSRRKAATSDGRHIGIGVAMYVEDTGLGPFEGAKIEILPSGRVIIDTGAASQGQGHATVFAQIAADVLGVEVADVTVRAADSDRYGYGISTAASRTAVTAGSSVHLAAERVADLARALAADHLEASEADLVLADGKVNVAGQPDASVTLAELAASVQGRGAVPIHPTIGPGLAAADAYRLGRPTYAFGCHVAEVDVDVETGLLTVLRYTVVHDCGTVLNPMIVDGQIDGAVAHGLGNALVERVVFSDDGQPLTTTFMDYRIMSAAEMPARLSKIHTETPSPDNPLGVKGAGEGGTLPVTAAIAAAVENALSSFGVVANQYPLTPATIRALIDEAARD